MAALPRSLNSYDVLKLIALGAMTVDHVGFYLLPDYDWLRIIGRIAAPAFLFLVGYNGRYEFRWPLLAGALIASLSEGLLQGIWHPQNILWTILFGRAALQWLERTPVTPVVLVAACAIWALPSAMLLECGTLGLVWMLFGRALKREGQSRTALLYGIVGFAGATAQALLIYDWSLIQCCALVALNAVLWIAFWQFTLKDVAGDCAPLRLLSRHALLYYIVHRMALQGASLL